MCFSHLPVKRYAGVAGESDERRPALGRRARCSHHLCWLRVRSKLKESARETKDTQRQLEVVYVKLTVEKKTHKR